MRLRCCTRRADLSKCIPIYIIGAVLVIAGIPLMIAGIVGGFSYSDFIGYVGGTSLFFGILFLFVWHMITIPNLDKVRTYWDDPEPRDATREEMAATKSGKATGFANLAFEKDNSHLPGTNQISTSLLHDNKGSTTSLSSTSTNQLTKMEMQNPQTNNSNNIDTWANELLYGGESERSSLEIAVISGNKVVYEADEVT